MINHFWLVPEVAEVAKVAEVADWPLLKGGFWPNRAEALQKCAEVCRSVRHKILICGVPMFRANEISGSLCASDRFATMDSFSAGISNTCSWKQGNHLWKKKTKIAFLGVLYFAWFSSKIIPNVSLSREGSSQGPKDCMERRVSNLRCFTFCLQSDPWRHFAKAAHTSEVCRSERLKIGYWAEFFEIGS